jgi:PKHD-type hydroxylase
MLVHIKQVLDRDELCAARDILEGATWGDGRVTAGVQSALAKNNQQLDQQGEASKALQPIVLQGLNRHMDFFSAALPKRVFPPLFNRYGGSANAFGNHVDNAVRFIPGTQGERVRTDISCTLFLAEPDEYDGGELIIEDTFGSKSIKLPAGDMVLYPGTSVHRVEPVMRGHRVASFFWVESMVRSDEQRRLLYEMDRHLMRLRSTVGEDEPAVIGLTGLYHNLLRAWADM